MNNFSIILFPFALLFALITELRNFLYDKKILKSVSFDLPIINVGNLSVGGTGKTPMIEYLIRLLENDYKILVVSRGYKRKTKGFVIADKDATPDTIGDEPYQLYRKFDQIDVVVGEDRVTAIKRALKVLTPDVILLDDAFQHRKIKAGLNIVLTTFQKPFYRDFILPAGMLRECKKNIKRANMVILTKVPEKYKADELKSIVQKIKSYFQGTVFTSSINYSNSVTGKNKSVFTDDLQDYKVLLITGIANPDTIYSFLSEKNINFDSLKFPDHHRFSKSDLQRIKKAFNSFSSRKKIILTTEKDYVRLEKYFNDELYYLSIQANVIENELFNKKILDYVSRNK
jgi:tetraacyldisaccharide 4'-kinase